MEEMIIMIRLVRFVSFVTGGGQEGEWVGHRRFMLL